MSDQAESKQRKGLGGFIHHQRQSVQEAGKAVASLLPDKFRDHADKSIKEAAESWNVLFEGVIDTAEAGLDKLRGKSAGEPGKEKVEIETD